MAVLPHKGRLELVARSIKGRCSVVSVMPAGVWGPLDPHLGEGATLCATF